MKQVWALAVVVCAAAAWGCGGEADGGNPGASDGAGGTAGSGDGGDAGSAGAGSGPDLIVYEGDFSPCGGDIIGQWRTTEAALNDIVTHPLADCPEATVTWTRYVGTGTSEYRDDGTFVLTGASSQISQRAMPQACLPASCAQYESDTLDGMQAAGAPGDEISFTCSEVDTICVCDMAAEFGVRTETYTYVVDGGTLTVTGTDGVPRQIEYCVTGDTLVTRTSTMTRTYVRI